MFNLLPTITNWRYYLQNIWMKYGGGKILQIVAHN